jgi:hypothetical protein
MKAAAFLLAGGMLLAIGGGSISEEWRLARHGVSTDGMILTKEVTAVRTYAATYRFMVPEGVFEDRARVPYDDWMRLKEDQITEVLYLPERPAISRLAGPQRWLGPAVMMMLGGVCIAAGALLLPRRTGLRISNRL